ncbi:MAG: valine--tRNA ligase [Candidatus Brennerbacteria bacterium RIFOXYD1_FULL_41_16]|uniref:Valine--tRNA ligase n=1 Tax=Candidatus Brennerbacteria bacterium RIFOXYD1_FULL_41_16 TaxID=1797529 RepID=A0A1G1XMC4_9BACT|nr:MAG: valine--tRNA ligase [Candidatus Brennerbacteria bacterium RIFOXYD1_FULL_41_16]
MTRELPKNFISKDYEGKLYSLWEEAGVFTPEVDKKKQPFTIILPLPNANDPMHIGHAMFVIQDILIRFHIMKGDPTLWLPGSDHAGMETQFVFEKQLAKEGKSRFDYDRETLFKMLAEFVEKNRLINKDQLKKLGFALDWSRYHYSMEPEIVEMVLETFRKLHADDLIYRGERVVHFCTKCGTSFSDLEVVYEDREDKLFYLDYGSVTIATTRPETIFADVAVAINPKNLKAKELLSQKAVVPLITKSILIIEDELVDPDFGTGALKITPGHDAVDFEVGTKHGLETLSVINRFGKMINVPEKYLGMKVLAARDAVVSDLKAGGKLVKEEPLRHSVGTCYRCGTVIEPMVFPQWFITTRPLADKAIETVRNGQTAIFPQKRFEKMYFDWMENIKDWNISRQVVWGPRIPAWYCLDCNDSIQVNFLNKNKEAISGLYKDLKDVHPFEEMKSGLQSLFASKESSYQLQDGACSHCRGKNVLQETDTFDTWFLSGQWPVSTLKSNPGDLEYFYPTSILDTLWDILFFWVGRMMMLGIYLTDKVPFKIVHLHARVVDKHGKKMSKSKGNVIDPLLMVNQYGADSLRLALVMGVGPASDVSLSDEKVRGMRNFTTKLWNIGRFIAMSDHELGIPESLNDLTEDDEKIINSLNEQIKSVTAGNECFRFGQSSEDLYRFIWHEFADFYIESSKERIKAGDKVVFSVLNHVFSTCLKLLHPFMPFVTEALWQEMYSENGSLLIKEPWPSIKD